MKENAKRGMRSAEVPRISPPIPKALSDIGVASKSDTPHSAFRAPHSVELHIEAVVIHGFAPDNRTQLVAAVERELTRLLGEKGVGQSLPAATEIARLHGGAFRLTPDDPAAIIGHQLAGAIYRSLNGGTRG